MDIHEEITRAASAWASEEEKQPGAREAKGVVYKGALKQTLKTMHRGKDPFTKQGRLRIGKDAFRALEDQAQRSDRTVRKYIRDLEARLEGLKRAA